MKPRDFSATPNKITELSRCEIFVFGSNLKGCHGGGAARVAMEKFGAEWGVGVGPTGRCYAIPTMQGGVETIEPYVNKFLEYAKTHPDNRFLVTRIGCGIAGFDDMEIAPLFEEAVNISNIALPKTWWGIIGKECGVWRTSPSYPKFPKVWTLKTLNKYTALHKYEIGAGINTFLPDLKVRYVKGRGEFGYAKFGDFFFNRDQMYVWETDDKYAEEHNEAVVSEVFHDECKGRGYVCQRIYAGVETNFRDTNGEIIYTGDVIEVQERNDNTPYYLALGAMADADGSGFYGFILDNHSWRLDDCLRQQVRITRFGTVYYQIGKNEVARDVNERVMDFNLARESTEDHKVRVLMTRYTPNFDQERWKYQGLEILGIEEFDWR